MVMTYEQVRDLVMLELVREIQEGVESYELGRLVSLTMEPAELREWKDHQGDFFALVKRAADEAITAIAGGRW